MKANHAAALVLLVSTVWIAGCGGSNNSSQCGKATGDKVGCNSAAAIGRSPLPDSPFAPRYWDRDRNLWLAADGRDRMVGL